MRLICDVLALGGAGCVVAGLWLAWEPLGFVALGLLLAGLGVSLAHTLARPPAVAPEPRPATDEEG